MSDCRFCEIVAEQPRWLLKHSAYVYSLKPFGALHPDHRMFIPRMHLVDAGSNPIVTGKLFETAAQWGKGGAFNLVVNSGEAADQTVPHLHVHYIPREAGDGLGYRWSST